MRNTLKVFHDGGQNGRIVMDREFSIKATIYGSEEYEKLQAARRDYPQYHVVRKTLRRNPKKESFNGLTYEYMEMYMDRYNVPAEIRKQYEDLRFNAKGHSIRYPIIKAWFLKTSPDMKDWGKTKEELDAATVA
jgi:hypothetical protein